MDKMIISPIGQMKEEAEDVRTFTFEHRPNAKPGQFVMLWIPDIDQKPFSVSGQTRETFDVTVLKAGKATSALFKKQVGSKLGISGPYGKGFSIEQNSNILLVAGGCGTAPLKFLGEEAQKQGCRVVLLTGAKSRENVLFADIFERTYVVTENGSYGEKGLVTDRLERLLAKRHSLDKAYICGPELMMKKAVEICQRYRLPCEVSLERYMKCGVGICGQCATDSQGLRVCQEGPVFTDQELKKITEFGHYCRDKSGIRQYFK